MSDNYKALMGVKDMDLALELFKQATNAWATTGEVSISFFQEMQPRNPLEAMLLGQMAAAYGYAMKLYREAGGCVDVELARIKLAERLMRSFASPMETLEKTRRKGSQSVRVEHFHVNAGGQAVVGVINQGGSSERP